VGRDGAGPLTVDLPSVGPVGTRQIFLKFFEKLCRVSWSKALGNLFIFFKKSLLSAVVKALDKEFF
jgi:hypothetical protein